MNKKQFHTWYSHAMQIDEHTWFIDEVDHGVVVAREVEPNHVVIYEESITLLHHDL